MIAPVLACAACYGDPNSPLSKGAVAGVLLLLGCIGSVLGGVIFLSRFWAKRARVYERERLAAISVGKALVWLAAEPGVVPFEPTGDEMTPEPKATRMVHDSWFGDSARG